MTNDIITETFSFSISVTVLADDIYLKAQLLSLRRDPGKASNEARYIVQEMLKGKVFLPFLFLTQDNISKALRATEEKMK